MHTMMAFPGQVRSTTPARPVPGDRGAGGGQQAVEGRRARGEHASPHRRRQCQMPVTLKGRYQNGHQRLEPLAADPV